MSLRAFPPRRLRALSPERQRGLRWAWFLALALAAVLDIAGAVYVLRDAYRYDVAFGRLALATEIESDGSVAVQTPPALAGVQAVPPGSHIVAVRGHPV